MIELLENRDRIPLDSTLTIMVVCVDEDDIREAKENCPEYKHFFVIADYLKYKDEFEIHLMTDRVSRELEDNVRGRE